MNLLAIKTIEESDDAIEYHSESSDGEEEIAKKTKKSVGKKNAFTFDEDGGSLTRGWEFKSVLGKEVNGRKSVDDVIEALNLKSVSSEDEREATEEVEDDISGDEEEEEQSDGEEEEAEDDDKSIRNQKEDIVREKRINEFFAEEPVAPQNGPIAEFAQLKLSRPIQKAVSALGFTKPTEIQARAIPLAMQGLDICGAAVTGSGKTAAFMIPILERLMHRPKHIPLTRVLVLVPTRELGVQCLSVAQNLAKFTDITFCLSVGGLNQKQQEAELRKRPDVVIATPGRLIDHVTNTQGFNLDAIDILVMDEADRILQDGFKAELDEIIRQCPRNRQTMLFSATMTENVDDLIRVSMQKPVRLFVDSTSALTKKLIQEFIRIRDISGMSEKQKQIYKCGMLLALVTRTYTSHTIIFFKSKTQVHYMKILFSLFKISAAELHGNLTQFQRLESLEKFKEGQVDFLLCTDLASRGIDIKGVKTVINFDLPQSFEMYIHRVGRTARAGSAGVAVSFVEETDRKLLKLAIKNTKFDVKQRVVPKDIVVGFQKKIEEHQENVKIILEAEKQERDISNAEKKVEKMENMIKYQDEILSRPKREWFQSKDQKAQDKEAAQAEFGLKIGTHSDSRKRKAEEDKPKRNQMSGLSRKKKRNLMAREEDKKAMTMQKLAAKHAKGASKQKKLVQIPEKTVAGKKGPAGKKGGSMFDSEMRKRKRK